jgi:hypothetical protein
MKQATITTTCNILQNTAVVQIDQHVWQVDLSQYIWLSFF